MAYDTAILKEKAIEAIKKSNLIFIEDVCAMIGISKSTFYQHFQVGSHDSNELNAIIEKNKTSLKINLRKKWLESDNPTTQIMLYKLCSTDIEHRKLQQNYTDITSKDEAIQQVDPFAIMRANHGINKETDTSD